MIVSIPLVALVGAMLLIPPLAFSRAFLRYRRRRHRDAAPSVRLGLLIVALLPLMLNIGFMWITLPELMQGVLETDEKLAMATLISWLAFWGRVALGRWGVRRRSNSHLGAELG